MYSSFAYFTFHLYCRLSIRCHLIKMLHLSIIRLLLTNLEDVKQNDFDIDIIFCDLLLDETESKESKQELC